MPKLRNPGDTTAAPDPLLASFERYLRAANRSDRTVANYLVSMEQTDRYLRQHGTKLLDASRADREGFLADLLTRRRPSTVATRHKVIKLFYAWLEDEEDISSPAAKLKAPMVPEDKLVPVLGQEELRRLFATCAGKSFAARRDTALLTFLLDTGARRAEIMDLKVSDLDFNLDVAIVRGKGRRDRALPFGRKTALALDRYLRVRARLDIAASEWLWLSAQRPGRLTEWGLVMMLRRRSAQGGLRKIHPRGVNWRAACGTREPPCPTDRPRRDQRARSRVVRRIPAPGTRK